MERIDTSTIYIRNAIANPYDKPVNNQIHWNENVRLEVEGFRAILDEQKPIIIFSSVLLLMNLACVHYILALVERFSIGIFIN